MIVIKDVSRTNSLWDLGSWAVKCIFLRQLCDCREDAVTMTVTINNLLKECDWVLYTVLSWRFSEPRTFIAAACGRRENKGPGKTVTTDIFFFLKTPWCKHYMEICYSIPLNYFMHTVLNSSKEVHMEGSSKQIVWFWQLLQQSHPPFTAPVWKWIIWSHFNCLCDS